MAELAVLRVGVDDLDEGYFAQQAARVLGGQVPYRDFESLYTPGLVYLHAWLFGVVGGPSLLAMRGFALGARAALALVLYGLTRPLVRQTLLAALPSVFVLVGLDDAPVRWEPHPGWVSTLFAGLAAWGLTHQSTGRWLFVSGAMAALAYVFKQNTGAFSLAAILLWAVLPKGGRLARAATALAGFGTVTVVWLGPLLVGLNGDVSALGVFVGAVNETSLFSPPEVALAIPLACLGGGIWVSARAGDPRLTWLLVAGTALFLTQYPRMDTLHLVWSAPLLLVLGAVWLDRVRWSVGVPAVLLGVVLVAPTVASRAEGIIAPKAKVGEVAAPIRTAAELSDTVADIQSRARPGQPIFVYPTSPLLYVLADRPNPTRFDHLNPGAATEAQIAEVIATLDSGGVKVAVVSDFWRAVWGPPGPNAPLEAWLDTRFTEVARHGAYRVLVARL